jgi:hypothetical protein
MSFPRKCKTQPAGWVNIPNLNFPLAVSDSPAVGRRYWRSDIVVHQVL